MKARAPSRIKIDDVVWEMKAPKVDNIQTIDLNVRRVFKQSCSVIIGSKLMKKVTDKQIEKKLGSMASGLKSLKRPQFVNRKREIIDIK